MSNKISSPKVDSLAYKNTLSDSKLFSKDS